MKTIQTLATARMSYQIVVIKWVFILFYTLFSALITGCNTDKEEEVNSQERLPFLGKYEMVDKNNNPGDGTFKYVLNITPSTKGEDKVELEGFRYVNNGIYARIKGNKMYISQAEEEGNGWVEVNGEGILEGNTLTYDYVLKYKPKDKPVKVFENSVVATRIE